MNEILPIIKNRHTDNGVVDEEQLQAIFSLENFLVVEAPAGYGKTKTMVSKIAYALATAQVPYPKKILALTFSINAAFKIRNDLNQQLPQIFSPSSKFLRESLKLVYATNYHGLCRRILKNYGFLISNHLSKVDSLRGVGISLYDNSSYTYKRLFENTKEWGVDLTKTEINLLITFTQSIKDAGNENIRAEAIKIIKGNFSTYLQIVKEKFLPKSFILFDSILLFTRQLFAEQPLIRNFYRRLFPIVLVDEFQDTNILQWSLLQDLIGRDKEEKSKLFLFGDQYQKIYEFLGAMDGIMNKAFLEYDPNIIRLLTNHRFEGNEKILAFDENLRKIAENLKNPLLVKNSQIDVYTSKDQDAEGLKIVEHIRKLKTTDPGCTLAILTRAGKENQNTIKLVECFNSQKENGFLYFYALYSDEDVEYVDFHKKSLASLYINTTNSRNFMGIARNIQRDMQLENPSESWISLLVLLKTFFNRINVEYRFLTVEEKINLVIDTLQNNALKQYLMYIENSQVTLSTIHGSKGLEWDYVIIPDMEKNSFPSYPGLCKACGSVQNCQPNWEQVFQVEGSEFSDLFKEELNVFYVGGTRARKSVFFTYSDEGFNSKGEKRINLPSCFLKLKGFEINELK